MRLASLIAVGAVAMLLSACAVADLVAHGVKEFDRSQNAQKAQPAAEPSESRPAETRREDEPPAPVYGGPAAAPSRGAVTVEELPPTR